MALIKTKARGIQSVSGVDGNVILQLKRTQFDGTNIITCTSDTDIVFTDLTVNITPSSTSSIIRLECMVNGEWSVNSATYNGTVFFFRDTTKLGHPTASLRNVGVSGFMRSIQTTDTGSTPEGTASVMFYDTPNTTSQITYKVGVHTSSAGDPVYHLNKTVTDADGDAYERFVSSITAIEIAG